MTLKALILLFLTTTILTSCGQETVGRKELDLMMPHGTKEDKPTAQDKTHSIELAKEKAILRLNGKTQVVSYKTLGSIFKNEKAAIKSKVFSVITHTETPYKTVVDVLDLLVINDIDRYKLLSADEKRDKSIKKVEASKTDTSFLHITILEKGYKAEFLNKVSELVDTTALDHYLADNKSKINGDKVLLDGPEDLPFQSFKPLLEVLKKHELYKFKMVSRK